MFHVEPVEVKTCHLGFKAEVAYGRYVLTSTKPSVHCLTSDVYVPSSEAYKCEVNSSLGMKSFECNNSILWFREFSVTNLV